MQPATRRVKTIYSVIASPNRLEILRILNTKGPLSYSELKTLAGFKSKKESGKFAYHLRKLVRQMLVTLNRAERRYIVTNLGRLILNLTRQIEEQTVLETGKLYVRTTHHTMEEFNSDKILQSLVKEAGMPVELAQKITSEAEARLYKFETNYLTGPLIREMVNALLIEHGYEEYRHKLTRLGLPVYDVTELINRVGDTSESIETVFAQTAQAVFAEYLLLAQLQKDVADAHLAGDINISNIGAWGLMPDTLFFDLTSIQTGGVNLANKLITIPRISAPSNLEEASSAFVVLTSLLSREVSCEVSFENYLPYFAKYASDRTAEELRKVLKRTFMLVPPSVNQGYGKPAISIQLAEPRNEADLDDALVGRVVGATIDAYREYVETTPVPQIRLVCSLSQRLQNPEVIKALASAAQAGGAVALQAKTKFTRAYSGLKKTLSTTEVEADSIFLLHSLSLNLPRLAYESNRDETYFRAKLALLLQTCVTALSTRRKIIQDSIKKGLLPTLALNSGVSSTQYIPLIVNLVGLQEAISNLQPEKASASATRALGEKIIETAVRVAADRSEKIGEKVGVAMIKDDADVRFATLDMEKYGRSVVPSKSYYPHSQLLETEAIEKDGLADELNWFLHALNGGFSVSVEVPKTATVAEVAEMIQSGMSRLEFFKLVRRTFICGNCGSKMFTETGRCKVCKSTSVSSHLVE